MSAKNAKIDFRVSALKDFTIRKRSAGWLEMLVIFTSIAIIAYAYSMSFGGSYDQVALFSILYMTGGGLSLYVALQVRRKELLVQSTEFLNALFSSALSTGYDFTMIIKNNSRVVYFNRPFQDIFPGFIQSSDRSVKNWLKLGNISAAEGFKIVHSVKEMTGDTMTAQIDGISYEIAIEPVERPHGFLLLRGVKKV